MAQTILHDAHPAALSGRCAPLSFGQERLWLVHQFDQLETAHNLPVGLRLSGPLDVSALEQSLTHIVRRHETLRTTFRIAGGTPEQVVAEPARVPLPVQTVGGTGSRADGRANELAIEEASRPFDLERGPLFRSLLLRLGPANHLLVIVAHHIVFDGISVDILFRELAALYTGLGHGQAPGLRPLAVQYRHFVARQRDRLRGGTLERLQEFWRLRLAGAPAVLTIRGSAPRPERCTYRGGRHEFRIEGPLAVALGAAAEREQASLFMTLLSAYNVVLSCWSGHQDVVIGTASGGRAMSGTEDLIGFFVNLLPIRTSVSPDLTLRSVVHRTREAALASYAHQELPFEKIVEAIRPARTTRANPLVQAVLLLQGTGSGPPALGGVTSAFVQPDNGTCKFDLVLALRRTSSGFAGVWNYSSDLFDRALVRQLSEEFCRVLTALAREPERSVGSLRLAAEWRDTVSTPQFASLGDRLRRAEARPVSIAGRSLVRTSPMLPAQPSPLLVEPDVPDLDPVEWSREHRTTIEEQLLQHGALLFRGFTLPTIDSFERFAQAICPSLNGDYGDLPREPESHRLYQSTPYPQDERILFHNESSHTSRWPMKQFFYCVTPARQGGETLIADGRSVYRLLPAWLVERFAERKLLYVRNFIAALDVSWQTFFGTSDRVDVEERCRREGVSCEWTPHGLRTTQVCPAVVRHPQTGETCFFNQVQLHHLSCLQPAVRASVLAAFGPEHVPRDVRYGDGSPIEDEVMAMIDRAYQTATVSVRWQPRDVLLLDNVLTAHARARYVGPRKIVVAMGEQVGKDSFV